MALRCESEGGLQESPVFLASGKMSGLQPQITVFERLLRMGATWLKKTKQSQPLVNSFIHFRNIFKRERVMSCIFGLIEALMGTD